MRSEGTYTRYTRHTIHERMFPLGHGSGVGMRVEGYNEFKKHGKREKGEREIRMKVIGMWKLLRGAFGGTL